MEYKITGGFDTGLKVYSDKNLIMFSTVKKNWFSSNSISIFDEKKTLILTAIVMSGLLKTTYPIEYQNSEPISLIENIENDIIEFSEKDKIEFKKNKISQFLNPYAKIYYKNSEIGEIRNKKIALELDYTISIKEEMTKLLPYVFIQILITESNKDYG